MVRDSKPSVDRRERECYSKMHSLSRRGTKMEAGITNYVWSLEELVGLLERQSTELRWAACQVRCHKSGPRFKSGCPCWAIDLRGRSTRLSQGDHKSYRWTTRGCDGTVHWVSLCHCSRCALVHPCLEDA